MFMYMYVYAYMDGHAGVDSVVPWDAMLRSLVPSFIISFFFLSGIPFFIWLVLSMGPGLGVHIISNHLVA